VLVESVYVIRSAQQVDIETIMAPCVPVNAILDLLTVLEMLHMTLQLFESGGVHAGRPPLATIEHGLHTSSQFASGVDRRQHERSTIYRMSYRMILGHWMCGATLCVSRQDRGCWPFASRMPYLTAISAPITAFPLIAISSGSL
jgi:hypothetical protein